MTEESQRYSRRTVRWQVHFFENGEWWNDTAAGDHMSLETAALTMRVRMRKPGVTHGRIMEVIKTETEVTND